MEPTGHVGSSVIGYLHGGNLVWDGVLRVTGMGPAQETEFVMSEVEKRMAALEQAAIALLAEARAAGINLSEVAEKAKNGLIANAQYTWISNHELKAESAAAVDYLVQGVKPSY